MRNNQLKVNIYTEFSGTDQDNEQISTITSNNGNK